MALAAVGIFCVGLENQLEEAVQQSEHLSLEATLLEGLRKDVTEQLHTLRDQLPRDELETRETSLDVQYLQGRAESLQGDNGRLRQALAVHKAAHGELMRRLALRDLILDGLRSEALAGRDGGAALSLEFYDNVEKELDLARAGFTREVQDAERRHSAAEQRLEGRLRKIIEAKEKEIIQLQLNFNALIRTREGAHSRDVTNAAAEIGKLRTAADEAQRQADITIESRVAEAVARERVAADLRAAEAASMRDAEIRYLKGTLDEQGSVLQGLQDRNRDLEGQVDLLQSSLSHVAHVELPHATEAVRDAERAAQAEQEVAANEAIAKAQEAQNIAEEAAEELKRRMEKLEADRELARQQASSLRTESANKDGAIRELTNQVANAERARSQARQELADALAEADLLRRSAAVPGDGSTTGDWIKRCEGLRAELHSAHTQSTADGEAHQKELNATLSALDRSRERNRQLEQEVAELQHKLGLLQMRVDSLQANLDTSNKSKTNLEKSVVNLRLERSGSTAASDRLRTAAQLARSMNGSSSVVTTPGGDADQPLDLSPSLMSSFSPRAGAGVKRTTTKQPMATHAPGVLSPRNNNNSAVGLRQPSPLPQPVPQKDACVECKILDLPIERVTVRAGTSIGHDTARAEQRAMNAFLRDELAILRILLRLPPPPSVHDPSTNSPSHSTYVEHEPIPVATADALEAQNRRLSDELRRRRQMARMVEGSAESVAAFSSRPGSSARCGGGGAEALDPVAELVRAACGNSSRLTRHSPDSDYIEHARAAAAAAAAAGGHPPPPPVDGVHHVSMRIVSPRSSNGAVRGAHINTANQAALQPLGAGFKRPKSASAASRPNVAPLSARPTSSFGEYSPRFRLAEDLVTDPVTYFAVGGRLHATQALAAEGQQSHPAPPPQQPPQASPSAFPTAAAAPSSRSDGTADGGDVAARPRQRNADGTGEDGGGAVNMRVHSRGDAPSMPTDAKLPASVTPRPPSAGASFSDVMRARRADEQRSASAADRPGAVRVGGAGFRQPQQRPWSARR